MGGTVGFYVPGTLTPKTTYSNQALSTPNANPLTLDSLGSALIWGSGSYREIVKNSAGVTIWDAVTASAGGGSGGGVTSFNTRTGAVTLTSGDVNGALGYTAQNCPIAGTGIGVACAGANATISTTGGVTQNVTQVADMTALKALTSAAIPIVVMQNYTNSTGGGGGVFVYVSSDTTTVDNHCTIITDAAAHRWYRQTRGEPIDIRWCGALGDGSTDDKLALQYALAIGPVVYVSPSANCYRTSGSLTISASQTLQGDSQNTSCIAATTADLPIVVVPVHSDTTNSDITVKNLTLDRLTIATAGGNGIGFTSYVNNTTLANLLIKNQYNGISVMSTDKSTIQNVTVNTNYNIGVLMTSSNWYPTMQWNLFDVFSTNNASDGFRATTAANTYPNPPGTGSCASMGTWTNVNTFANTGYGANFIGISSTYCMEGVRIVDGFFGQDGNDEIHLDTYSSGGGQNTIRPNYVELAGTGPTGRTGATAASHVGSGIYLSANTGPTLVSCWLCNGNSQDGLVSFAYSLEVVGGNYTNNGQACGAGRRNGIFIAGGNAYGTSISGVTSGNTTVPAPLPCDTATTNWQLYGISLTGGGDYVSVAGGNLLHNHTDAVSGLGCTNCLVVGVLPLSANTAATGGSYCALSGCTMTGAIAMSGNNISGVGTLGTSGLATLGSLSVTGAMSINSGMTIVGSSGITGTSAGITMLDGAFTRSLGVGTGAPGINGDVAISNALIIGAPTGSYQTSSINVAGSVLTNNVGSCLLSGCTMTGAIAMGGNNISGVGTLGTSGLATLGSLSVTGAMSINGGLTVVGASGITGASSGITMQDGAFTRSAAVGTTASGVSGDLAVNNAIIVGSPTGSYQTNSINVAGSLLVNNVSTPTGSFCALSGCTMSGAIAMGGNNISGVGTLGTSGLATLGSLSVTGAASMNAGLTMVGATGITGSSSGITMQDGAFTRSVGVGAGASGTTGRIDTTTLVASQDLTATRSLGVGTAASTNSGRIDAGVISASGAISSASSIAASSTLSSGGLATLGSLSVTGAASMNAGLTMVGSTGISGSSSGITMQDASFTRSLGVGTGASGTTGRTDTTTLYTSGLINVGTTLAASGNISTNSSLQVNTNATVDGTLTVSGTLTVGGTSTQARINAQGLWVGGPTGSYAAGNVSAAGTIYADTGIVSNAAMAFTSCLYAVGATGTCVAGTGTINAKTGVYLNGTAYTNP